MADLFIFIVILSSMALAADIVERVLTYKKEKKEANNERTITIDYEYSEEAIKGDDNMDYVELNGEKIPYNEDDQE